MSSSRQQLARRLRDHARAQAVREARVFRATVTKLSPLTVELVGSGLELEQDDDFDLTGGLKMFQAAHGIAVDDTLLLHREDGHYAAFDLLTEAI